jgi:hypothetical protein
MIRYLMFPCLLVALILICGCYSVHAQYTTAVGIRVGGTSGVTIKHAYRPTMMFEGIVGGFGNGFSLTGLIEKNTRAFNEPGFNWYYGGGAHVSVYNGRRDRFGREVYYGDGNDVGFGINGIIGLEYRMPDDVPIAFSFDFKPFVEITTGGDAGFALDPAIGIKFIFR